nr:transposase [Chloroflexota bacterium]
MQLKQVIPWQCFTYKLIKYYQGQGQQGRPPYDPALVLKMLLLAYLYNLSERQVEEYSNFYLPAKHFLALSFSTQNVTKMLRFSQMIISPREPCLIEKMAIDERYKYPRVKQKPYLREAQGTQPDARRDGAGHWSGVAAGLIITVRRQHATRVDRVGSNRWHQPRMGLGRLNWP